MSERGDSSIAEEVVEYLRLLKQVEEIPQEGLSELADLTRQTMLQEGALSLYEDYGEEMSRIADLVLSEIAPGVKRFNTFAGVLVEQARVSGLKTSSLIEQQFHILPG